MKISIICAMDEKRGIGKNNKIPWHIKEDLVKLKTLTKDHVVILGRKTYDSMVFYYNRTGRPMPGKLYIVVTRDKDYKPTRENVRISHSLDESLKNANVILNEVKDLGSNGIPKLIRQAQSLSDNRRQVRNDKKVQGDKGKEVFIIGGGQIFQQALPFADKLYLTIVQARLDSPPESPARRGDYNCDAFFPDYSEFKKVVFEESHEGGGYKYKFLELERG